LGEKWGMNRAANADLLREIPLRDVLQWQGFEVQPEGVSYRARNERHNIVTTGSRWFDNKSGVGGGGAIDLCQHLTGADFATACRFLEGNFRRQSPHPGGPFTAPRRLRGSEPKRASFLELVARYAMPDESSWPGARDYLVKTRRIEAAIVDQLHAVGSIYANDHRPNPSIVFLHRTRCGRVEGATLRDTRHESAFRPCLGAKQTAWFVVGNLANARTVVGVESPIDALSYWTLYAEGRNSLAVASCSGSVIPTELMANAYERRQSFIAALDNDSAGLRGWQKAWNETADWIGFKITCACPQRKDWNADLIALRSPHAAHPLTQSHHTRHAPTHH
jgi:hypothetical protein